LEPLLKGTINTECILNRWDDMLRVVGSLKLGWVTASLFIGKLQSFPQQNALLKALQEYGRLVKTIFILRYLVFVRLLHKRLDAHYLSRARSDFGEFACSCHPLSDESQSRHLPKTTLPLHPKLCSV